MSLGGILILVLLVISLAIFIYLVVITAQSWGVLHTIMLSFLFIECWTFLLLSGQVLNYRLTDLKEFTETRKELQKLVKENYEKTWGGDNAGADQQSLVALNGAVRRLTADRGRLWRGATKIGIENGQAIRLTLAAPVVAGLGEDLTGLPPAAPAAPAAGGQLSTIPLEMVVYAFSQTRDEKNNPIPQYYLGEFKVVESNPGQVLLRPTLALEPNQVQAVDREVIWSLYELLPQDSHEAFLAEGATPSDDAAFGRADEQLLNSLLTDIPEEDGRRAKIISDYMRNGTPAQENDPPRNVWVKIEAVKPIVLDVDSEEKANATVGGYFDPSGRTVDERIKRGTEKNVTLPEGKQILLPLEKGNEYVANGSAKLIQRIFVRSLNAYEKGFGNHRIRLDDLSKQIDIADRELKVLDEANRIGTEMKKWREEVEKVKLAADLEQFSREKTVITNELSAMNSKLEKTRQYVIQLYQSLHATHDGRL